MQENEGYNSNQIQYPNNPQFNNYETPYTVPPNYQNQNQNEIQNLNQNSPNSMNQNNQNNNYDTFNNFNNFNNIQRNIINIKQNEIEERDPEQKITESIRRNFVKKVYGILSIQLLITFILICFSFSNKVRNFYIKNMWLIYVGSILGLIIIIIFACFKTTVRKFPYNYILLFIWTLCEAIVASAIASKYNYKTVITAIGILAGIVIGLTIFASLTKIDFTKFGMALVICGFGFCLFGLFGFLFGEWLNCLYCVIGVILFSAYLVYDTQLILGKFGSEYNIDDYVFAAVALYLDIINLFLLILRLVGRD
jgi:hypothetical protein